METLSHDFRTGCPWELLYAHDLVIIAEALSELLEKFRIWKANLESKGLSVNVGQTKILVSVHNALNQLMLANFYVVCAIRVLGLTLSSAMPVAFGCTNAVQTSRVL